ITLIRSKFIVSRLASGETAIFVFRSLVCLASISCVYSMTVQPASPVLQPIFPYPSSVRYPYDTHIYRRHTANRRRFTEGYTANLRKKHTFGAGKDKAGIGPGSCGEGGVCQQRKGRAVQGVVR